MPTVLRTYTCPAPQQAYPPAPAGSGRRENIDSRSDAGACCSSALLSKDFRCRGARPSTMRSHILKGAMVMIGLSQPAVEQSLRASIGGPGTCSRGGCAAANLNPARRGLPRRADAGLRRRVRPAIQASSARRRWPGLTGGVGLGIGREEQRGVGDVLDTAELAHGCEIEAAMTRV